jgi:tetratricopeptide (TPR) repeat protein
MPQPLMIREHDESNGKSEKPLDARQMLQRMERLLRQTRSPRQKQADEAQQLVYDAWDAETEEREHELMCRALEINPGNADALLYMLDRAGLDGEEEIQALRNIVAAAEKGLGPKAFNEYAGGFWGFIETRPYMRARARLAASLRAAGRLEDAIAEYEAMLVLNPNDNQGLRHELLPAYLALNRLEPARALLQKYDEAGLGAVFSWCAVLERWLSGDLPAAKQALAVARKQNPHIQVYIKGHREVPNELPGSYSIGSKEEALCFAEVLRSAWARHPQALTWLAAQKIK